MLAAMIVTLSNNAHKENDGKGGRQIFII